MLFDTHVNLHSDAFAGDLPEVIGRAREAGVDRMIAICDKLESFDAILEIIERNDRMWCSVGVHPHYAKDHASLTTEVLLDLANNAHVCGIGETGLDQHYGYSDLATQIECFSKHVAASQASGLPLIVHTREADEETASVLERAYAETRFPLLMHCYTSGVELAQRAIAMDAYFSASGILSFKNANAVREVIAMVPRDRLILETDCPYLAPVPMRGRRNEPAFLVHVCRAVADLWGMDPTETARVTTENALRLFERVT